MGYMQEDLISVLSWNVNNVEQEWDGVAQWGYGIWQIGEESGSAMNPEVHAWKTICYISRL
jgi:hypothetical protein